MYFFIQIGTGTESDVVTNELRNRKETPAIESNVNEAINDIETISQAITQSEDRKEEEEEEKVEEVQEKEVSETNEDKITEPSESVKTHIDKKNE